MVSTLHLPPYRHCPYHSGFCPSIWGVGTTIQILAIKRCRSHKSGIMHNDSLMAHIPAVKCHFLGRLDQSATIVCIRSFIKRILDELSPFIVATLTTHHCEVHQHSHVILWIIFHGVSKDPLDAWGLDRFGAEVDSNANHCQHRYVKNMTWLYWRWLRESTSLHVKWQCYKFCEKARLLAACACRPSCGL